ncbi:MAG: ABC transporter ATP-binding protein [Clostridia bacterium]|nr:ABC transporter ATP-binding protein [Clostridia bacterium]MDD4146727.1 ABC transporter ATP-binding protein [Clostridia bacterium]MDD4666008.1 ABC transporter ATP-binding protein [Clostridia bacterium]
MLKIINLSKTYQTKAEKKGLFRQTLVLDQISLQVKEGEFVSIVGPSGCGKSTLFNLISGLEKPEQGQILLKGREITGEKGHVSYMLQKDLLLPWRTVLDNCILGMELQGHSRKECRQKAQALLDEFALSAYSRSYPQALSGGMRQRVAFLRTMLANKELLLLDEPFGSLDAYTKSEMHEWLMSVWSKYRATILFITHDIEEALFLSDRIYVLSAQPAQVKISLEVNLPRPRSRKMLVREEFNELKKQLLQALFE